MDDKNLKSELSITIELDDGVEKDCFIVATPNDKYGSYIALLPKEKKYILSGHLLLYKVIELNGQMPKLEKIEDDAVYDHAVDLLNEIIDDQNYYELLNKYKNEFNNKEMHNYEDSN